MTGGWVEDNPDCVKELVKRGHDLGNHSQHHYDMTTISQSEKESELKSVHDKVKELTGYEMFLFRPPYGAYDNEVIKTAYALNYYPIQWSVDSLDWKDYGVDSIIDTVCNHKALGPGAIILCHNGAKYTADALDTMLTNLEEQGYTIVPISELIMRRIIIWMRPENRLRMKSEEIIKKAMYVGMKCTSLILVCAPWARSNG